MKLFSAIYNLLLGMKTTSKHLFRHAITLQYPEEKWPMPERSRGIVVLLSDKETGELNCTSCLLCMKVCPSAAIKIEQHRDEETKKRILDEFIVDHTICCFCGLCQDTCNFAAIKLAPKYEFSTLTKEDLIWNKDKLQEMGRDVPYEKPVKKKKPVAEKTAKTDHKPEEKPDIKGDPGPTEVGPEIEEAANPAGTEMKKPEEKPADESDDPKADISKSGEETK